MQEQATLPQIRRFEAVSFRSFPSTSTHYDGTWAIRLTAGLPNKRLNSITPLDPSDHAYVDARLELAKRKFESFGRELVFRQSPLAPQELEQILDERGWERFDETIVMLLDLSQIEVSEFVDRLPLQDLGSWVDAFIELSDKDKSTKPGMFEVISSIEPNSGLFLKRENENSASALRCVHDRDLVGFFDVVTGHKFLRQKHASDLFGSSLKWAKQSGARHAWLQVTSDNVSAIKLYESFGFQELYRYSYRKAPK